jgi:hypothetical protein
VADFDPTVPSIARVYDYLLGGKDNDIDAVVLAHLRVLAAQGNPGVTVIDGDAREIDVMLAAIGGAIDLAPGSYLVFSVSRTDDNETAQGFGTYSSASAAQAYNHSVAEFTSFFGPLPLVPPGVVDARNWHTEGQSAPLPPRAGQTLVGVARI